MRMQILSRLALMVSRHVTAEEVARAAGVSQSAVSRAFTPGASISPPMRERVRAAADALGYRPNALARSLITSRSRIIGVVAAYLHNHFYPSVLDTLSRALQARGYQILLLTADAADAAEGVDATLDALLRYRVDAVILASVTLSSGLATTCRAAGIPVLLFNRTSRAPGVGSVTGENRVGGHAIARHFVATGRRRPAFIAGVEDSSTSRDRERGFTEGLREAGVRLHGREVGYLRFDGAAEAARRLLRQRHRPDAIFAASDHMAIAVMGVARHECGLNLPGDLALAGFDDTEPASWPDISLTSYAQPAAEMACRAAEAVLAMVERPGEPARHQVVPGRLVVRGSSVPSLSPAARSRTC